MRSGCLWQVYSNRHGSTDGPRHGGPVRCGYAGPAGGMVAVWRTFGQGTAGRCRREARHVRGGWRRPGRWWRWRGAPSRRRRTGTARRPEQAVPRTVHHDTAGGVVLATAAPSCACLDISRPARPDARTRRERGWCRVVHAPSRGRWRHGAGGGRVGRAGHHRSGGSACSGRAAGRGAGEHPWVPRTGGDTRDRHPGTVVTGMTPRTHGHPAPCSLAGI